MTDTPTPEEEVEEQPDNGEPDPDETGVGDPSTPPDAGNAELGDGE